MDGRLYSATPFQQWLTDAGVRLRSWANTGEVILPVGRAQAVQQVERVHNAFWLSRAALVRDGRHGVVFRVTDHDAGTESPSNAPQVLAEGFSARAVARAPGGCQVSVRMPGGLGDVWTVRLIQQALASQPTADASGEVALRYGQWQRSLAGLGAASQALDPGGEPGKSSLPESGLGLWFERCGEVTGARGLQHVELPGTAARTVHEVAACLGVEACAVLLGCWRMVLHAMGCTEPIWVAVNGRRPPVAADAAGPLTAYRRWSDAEAGNRSVVDTLRRAGTWLGEAVVRQPAWDDSQAPRGLPALAFSPVPAPERIEIAGGTAELLAPTPAPFGQTMDLAAWLRNDRLGLALSFDTGRLRPADIAGVLATLGRVITDLPSLARGQAPWRGRSRTVARTPPAPSSARDPLDIWRRLAASAGLRRPSPDIPRTDHASRCGGALAAPGRGSPRRPAGAPR
jgi:hypothetical protein